MNRVTYLFFCDCITIAQVIRSLLNIGRNESMFGKKSAENGLDRTLERGAI